MPEFEVIRTTYTKERCYVDCKDIDQAEEFVNNPKNDLHWEDITDERLSEEIEIEEV